MSDMKTTASRPAAHPVTAFFDLRASDYDREYRAETPGGYALRVRRRKVMALFDADGGRVLDIGCGPGVMARCIAERGCTFCGVDPSEAMLRICRDRFSDDPRISFVLAEAAATGLPDDAFDAVLCMGVIDMVDDQMAALREAARVLRPGGSLIITFTNARSPYAWWKKRVLYPAVTRYRSLWSRSRSAPPPDATRRTLFSRRAACASLRLVGLEVAEVQGYYYNLFLSPIDEWLPKVALRVTRAIEESDWRKPDAMASGWIVKARKPAVSTS